MMKKLLLLPALWMAFSAVMAQKVESKNISVGDTTVPGYLVTIEKKANLVEDAMRDRLDKADLKTKKSDGFVVAEDQLFAEISSDPINFYAKVKKEGKNESAVMVCAYPSHPGTSDKKIEGNLRSFIEGFVTYVDKYEARKNMEAEQENLKKAKKRHASAVATVEKLEKGIQRDQEKIADKQKDAEKYAQKLKDCQEDIEKLKANISKNQEKKLDAQKEVEEALQNIQAVEQEVAKHRSLSE